MVQLLIAANLIATCALYLLLYKAIKLLDHMSDIYHDLTLRDTRYMLQALKENNHKREKEL